MAKANPDFLEALRSLFRVNMGAQPGERVVILSDTAPFLVPDPELPTRESLCSLAHEAARTLSLQAVVILYPPTGGHGKEPPASVFSQLFPPLVMETLERERLLPRLLEKTLAPHELARLEELLRQHPPAFEILVAFSRYSLTHTRFRRLLTASGRVRVATMPGVEPRMFLTAMQADWAKVRERSLKVAELLSAAHTAEILTPPDHRFVVELKGRSGIADTGIIAEPGSYGNLPGGEGFIAPLEGTARGTIACGPPEKPGERLLAFEKGEVVQISGPPQFRERFAEAWKLYPLARSLAELGVGTNERAEDTENILEAEKILGTVHVAMGDNFGFGGTQSVPFHQDVVIFHPTLILHTPEGAVTLLKQGRWLLTP